MNELKLIDSEQFEEIQCDFYSDGKEPWMTRDQIGAALEYSDPIRAISKLHTRKKARLDKFSAVVKLTTTDGKTYDTTLYNRKGVMEICRHSDQPRADAFMDFCWDTMDGLMSGKTKLIGMTEYQQMMAQTRAENARIRKAQILTKLADKYDGTTYQQVLNAHATKELTGDFLLPLPKLEAKTYSAGEVGDMLGITGQMVGILTNRNNKWLPVICGVLGGVLGPVAMTVGVPEFPAGDMLTAVAVGIASGLAATGVNQVYKQLRGE